jgi:hypothetical protein
MRRKKRQKMDITDIPLWEKHEPEQNETKRALLVEGLILLTARTNFG